MDISILYAYEWSLLLSSFVVLSRALKCLIYCGLQGSSHTVANDVWKATKNLDFSDYPRASTIPVPGSLLATTVWNFTIPLCTTSFLFICSFEYSYHEDDIVLQLDHKQLLILIVARPLHHITSSAATAGSPIPGIPRLISTKPQLEG